MDGAWGGDGARRLVETDPRPLPFTRTPANLAPVAKILIIEDQATLCRLYQSVLGRAGHEVTLAQTGEAGVAAAARVRPDLVILDLTLPGMSGAEVARKLAEGGTLPAAPIIITTALGDSHARGIAASLGAPAVLLKPFDIDVILTAVHGALLGSSQPGSLPGRSEKPFDARAQP